MNWKCMPERCYPLLCFSQLQLVVIQRENYVEILLASGKARFYLMDIEIKALYILSKGVNCVLVVLTSDQFALSSDCLRYVIQVLVSCSDQVITISLFQSNFQLKSASSKTCSHKIAFLLRSSWRHQLKIVCGLYFVAKYELWDPTGVKSFVSITNAVWELTISLLVSEC